MGKVASHRGKLKSSERQQKVLKAMRGAGWLTGMDISMLTFIPNPAEAISALRANGVKIEKRAVPGERYVQWRLKR